MKFRSEGALMASFARMGEEVSVAPAPLPWQEQEWAARLEKTIERGANHLLSLQAEQGYWQGELEADTTLESDYIYYLNVLGKADPERIAKLANYVRRRQLADGGWSIYPGGPFELNATCKAYFALKLAGDSTDARHMAQARETIHRLGGLEHTNSYVRFYLALVGAVGWDLVPSIPPELMLLPQWFYFNIYEMSSWTRGIVIPMAILSTLRPDWRLPMRARVDELFKDPTRKTAAFDWSKQLLSWKNVFLALDRGLKLYEKLPWKPLRQRALREAKSWMLNHIERTEGLAAIYPAMMNSIFVLMALQRVKYADAKRMEGAIRRGIQWLLSMQNRDGGWGAFDRDNDHKFLCNIPFADHNAMIDPSTADVTARVVECLGRSGWPADHPAIQRAVKFLLKDQSSDGSWFGRWGVNYIYGTSGVLRALETVSLTARDYCQRAVVWLRTVQKADGSFGESLASYETPSTKGQGPSTASQTAWGLIGLLAGTDASDPAIGKAVSYLVHKQREEGSWNEPDFTGTGFPGVFYLKYHLYRNSFPVYALARYSNQSRGAHEYVALKFQPGEFRLRSGF